MPLVCTETHLPGYQSLQIQNNLRTVWSHRQKSAYTACNLSVWTGCLYDAWTLMIPFAE